MAIFGCCFVSESQPQQHMYPRLGRVLGNEGEVVPTLRRISERSVVVPTPTPLHYRRITERAPIESAIHDAQIKVSNAENLLTAQQKKILLQRMQEVHTFFYDVFNIEAVPPEQIFPPLNGRKEGPDNAEWTNDVKKGWNFGGKSISLETVAHEYIHAVVQRMLNLDPEKEGSDEEDALNESLADVFASIFKQYKARQNVEMADWQMTDEGESYRSLTTFPTHGKYPKMTGKEHDDAAIPNYAFYHAAMVIKGNSWDVMGKIWCEALKNTKISKEIISFPPIVSFSQETIAATQKLFPKYEAIIRQAWTQVGVDPNATRYLT